jgi:putative membrane-bound dehydrogenase-like protein
MPNQSMKFIGYIGSVLCCASIILFATCSEKKDVPGFHVEDGLTWELVAAEPLIRDPVDLAFTIDGNMLVLEMPGYPSEDAQSRIMSIKDENGDGVNDESTVFAEDLLFATSLLPWNGGVLVAAPPYLLYLKDRDLDGHAEHRDTLMGGFAMENLQHNYNGLTYGLDSWIYAANGGNSGAPYWWGDTISRMDLRNQDFRFNIKERKMERLGESSGGFGLAMDEFGRFFGTHNLTHVSQIVFPSRYFQDIRIEQGHTLVNVSDHDENGLARIYPVGEQETRVNHPEQSGYFSGSCGILWYGDGALGDKYNGSLWVADVVLNLIHVDKLEPKGSASIARRSIKNADVVASEDRSFRPVNLVTGPDGAIYVIDMYRKVIEHPEWIPDEIEKTLDLSEGKDKGRIYRISGSQQQSPLDFRILSTDEGLVKSLGSPIQWVRMNAHHLLIERKPSGNAIQLLSALTQSENPLARLHAHWVLHSTENNSAEDVADALTDATAGVRENALIMAERFINADPDLFNACVSLLLDENARVRMQAALTVSIGLNHFLAESGKDAALKAIVSSFRKGGDQWNAAALTIASKNFPAEVVNHLLATWEEGDSSSFLLSLATLSGDNPDEALSVLKSLNESSIPSALRGSVIQKIADGNLKPEHARSFIPVIQELERSSEIAMIASLASLRNRLALPPSARFLEVSKSALSRVLDSSQPDSVRLKQMSVIALLPFEQKASTLYASLDHREPVSIQESALRQLSAYDDKSIGEEIVRRWKTFGPHARKWASDLLIYREIHHDALLTGLENGVINIGEMNFDLERRRALLSWTDNPDTRRRASAFFTDEGVLTRKDAFQKMLPALTLTGNAERGADVFASVCSTCHQYGGRGQNVGPNLTEIGRKSKETILHDILDPNAATDTRFISHRVETLDGNVHIGIVDAESDLMLTIKKTGGEKVVLNKKQIKSFQSLGTSLMPEGLENNFSHQQMADLLEFLQAGVK